jgi:predicted dehydrogenase
MTSPVRIAIVGLGRWSRAHAAAASRRRDVALVAGCSRSEAKRTAFAEEYAVRTWATLEEVLADDEVEAVVLSTPNDLHAEMALAVVGAGKAVLIDKPLAVSVEEGLAVLRESAGNASRIGVAHHARRLAGHRAARRWIEDGTAGRVRLAFATFSNIRGARMSPDAWHRRVAGSEGGVLIQVGIHQVDNLHYLLGPSLTVNARFGYGALGPEIPETAALLLTHADGVMSALTTGWVTPSNYRLDLQATGGNLMFRLDHGWWTSPEVDHHAELLLEGPGETAQPHPTTPGDPLGEQLGELAAAVRTGTAMEVGVVEGLRAMAVVEAAVRSAAADGAPVDLASLLAEAGATSGEIDLVLRPGDQTA